MDGWHVWCGSAIRGDDGLYHLFASRWPEATGFPEGYRQHSEIVRAVSENPLGPYRFEDVVIAKRAAGKWDSAMAHNPAIYRVGNQYVLYYIGADEGSAYRQIGVATAPSLYGPWARRDEPLGLGVRDDANNPSACFAPDGSLRLVWRNAALKVCISTAPSFEGPFRLENGDVWPKAKLEDFFFFRQDGAWRIVCEDNVGAVSGHERWGVGLESADGIAGWKPWEKPVVYDHQVRWTDGGAFTPVRRERPWLLLENGGATQLFTGVWDGKRAWNQPVPLSVPWGAG
jgi:hypothetical protein